LPFSQVKNSFPNYGSLELPEQLSDRVISLLNSCLGPIYAFAARFSPQMSNEIAFDTNLSEPIRTRADFTYKITPTVISIVDTGLGSGSVATEFGATEKRRLFSL
jgi:hypothetical protein